MGGRELRAADRDPLGENRKRIRKSIHWDIPEDLTLKVCTWDPTHSVLSNDLRTRSRPLPKVGEQQAILGEDFQQDPSS